MGEVYKQNKKGWPSTRQQDDLCHAIVVEGLSLADAGRKVGYADSTVKKLLSKIVKRLTPYIEHLRIAKQEVIQRNFDVTVDTVVEELAAMGFVNPKNYICVAESKDGSIIIGKPPNELTDEQAKAVSGWTRVKVDTEDGHVFDYQYKFHDKRASLRDMGQHLGMYNEKLILEQRITKTYKIDLSGVPDAVLEKWMSELKSHAVQPSDHSGAATIDHDTGTVS